MWTYSKWDNLDSDSDGDGDGATAPPSPLGADGGGHAVRPPPSSKATPTRFDFGEEQVEPLEADLTSPGQRTRLRSLPLVENEVWQLVVRRLRVWNAAAGQAAVGGGGSDQIPIQPQALLLCALYPEGKLLSYTIGVVPESPPTPSETFAHLTSAMLNPSVGAQRRPGKVVCVDAKLAGALFRSLESLGVECTQLSEPTGIDDYVKLISDQLVAKSVAARGDISEMPGLLGDKTLTEAGLMGLFTQASSLLRDQPWVAMPPVDARHLVVKITLLRPITVLGDSAGRGTQLERGDSVWLALLHDDEMMGFAIFWCRLDCEARMLPPTLDHADVHREAPRCAYEAASLEATTATAAVEMPQKPAKLKRTKPRSYDLRAGSELVYNSAQAQRLHWPDVKPWSRPLSERDEGIAQGRKWWARPPLQEASLLYREATLVPFDDHDTIRRFGLPVPGLAGVGAQGTGCYPVPMQFKSGGVAAGPTASVCMWLEVACAVAAQLPGRMGCWLDTTGATEGASGGGGQAGGCGGSQGALGEMDPAQAVAAVAAARSQSTELELELERAIAGAAANPDKREVPPRVRLTFDPVLLESEVCEAEGAHLRGR